MEKKIEKKLSAKLNYDKYLIKSVCSHLTVLCSYSFGCDYCS